MLNFIIFNFQTIFTEHLAWLIFSLKNSQPLGIPNNTVLTVFRYYWDFFDYFNALTF